MVKRRKGRSVKNNVQVKNETEEFVQAPHSFVIHRGLPGGYTMDLTKDFRKIMEPFTASSLKVRKKNTIKDFVSISGLLHVSHLCIFTCTEIGLYFKIGKLPRGPTLTFKVHNFSLTRDVVSSLKKQYVNLHMFDNSPLIILNNFSGEGMHLKLMASTFQNLFPTINLTNVNLSSIRRCVLLNYNPTSKLVDLRHYAIRAIPTGLSKGVKKLVQGKVPNLARCEDISELLTKAMLSESEFEDDPSSHVTLPQKLSSRGNVENSKSAIRLSELGPRLTLQLIKVEEGLLDGEVLFHEYIQKTDEEVVEARTKLEKRRKLKDKRKRQQELNLKKKSEKKEELKQKSLKGMQKGNTENDRLMKQAAKEGIIEDDSEVDDDAEYYKQEVGEEPEKDLFPSHPQSRKRPMTMKRFKNKKAKLNDNAKNQSDFVKRKDFKSNKKSSGKKYPGGRAGNPKYGIKRKAGEKFNANSSKKGTKRVQGSKVRKTKKK